MSETSRISIQKYSWYKSRNGQRLFLIVGHWYTQDPAATEVDILELYQSVPIRHSLKEMERLITSGDIIPV